MMFGISHAEGTSPPLYSLPSELLDHVCSLLPPESLAALCQVSSRLRLYATDDRLWQRFIQENTPGQKSEEPPAGCTFRQVFQTLYPHWFLSRHKIWFGDTTDYGSLLIARYDDSTGTIEAHRLVAERDHDQALEVDEEEGLLVPTFRPRVQLHTDTPMFLLNSGSFQKESEIDRSEGSKFVAEIQIEIPHVGLWLYAYYALCRSIPEELRSSERNYWPPRVMPAQDRVESKPKGFDRESRRFAEPPDRLQDASMHSFRLQRRATQASLSTDYLFTYSTLMPELYTPTPEKPWRGIWIGDYGPHRCEFLLVHQPDAEVWAPLKPAETCENSRQNGSQRNHIASGRLAAIKLTGDPNVPRGEITFSVDEVGDDGMIRVVEQGRFKGARVVRSRGHLASEGFVDDYWTDSELFLISHNTMAHYWRGFGHVSLFFRVDIDHFLDPRVSTPLQFPTQS